MKVLHTIVALLASVTLVLAAPAHAIVDGVIAGDRLANVGMLVGKSDPAGPWRWLHCSGVLVSRNVFLTAGHCVAPASDTGMQLGITLVSEVAIDQAAPFGTPIPESVNVYAGTGFAHPDFDAEALTTPETDSFDLGVVVLDTAIEGGKPARIVEANHFNSLEQAYRGPLGIGLAGYGLTSFLPVLGAAPFDWGVRRYTTGSLGGIFPAKVTVHPAPGQICGGDSGGPGLLVGARGLDEPLPMYASVVSSVVSFTVLSPSALPCATASILYRLDTPQARSFLSGFVPGM